MCTRDRQIVTIERVYTPSTFYMKSAVDRYEDLYWIIIINRKMIEIIYIIYESGASGR